VIGDRLSTLGFRLAGVRSVRHADSGDRAEKELAELMDSKDIGIIIISHSIMGSIRNRRLLYRVRTSLLPLVLEIPGYNEKAESADTLRELVMRVIGIDIFSDKARR
jgi:vacuolar-type H+-ATPase subunit F/Vma7